MIPISKQWKDFTYLKNETFSKIIENVQTELKNEVRRLYQATPHLPEREILTICSTMAYKGVKDAEKKIKAVPLSSQFSEETYQDLMKLFLSSLNLEFYRDSSKFQSDLREILKGQEKENKTFIS